MSAAQRLASAAKLLIGVWLAGVVIAMFLVVPRYEGLGNAGRIIIMHVPTAWVCVLAFAVSAAYSALYLWRGRTADDDRALAAAESGFVFTVLATVTGMIFSQVVWGVYWNWDPRQTSIFVLLLIYAALFALRSAIDDPDRRRRLSAVYSLFAFVTVPFLIFIAPRLADSTLHPNCAFIQGSKCDGIELGVGKIGLLGDRKVQLVDLRQQGDTISAQVKISEPGLRGESTVEPTFSMAEGRYGVAPEFPGTRFKLILEGADAQAGTARLNIEAPGTGLLENRITLFTFLASILGFTALFVWMFRVRSTLLGVQWDLERRQGALA
jgi:heme exporter protein C